MAAYVLNVLRNMCISGRDALFVLKYLSGMSFRSVYTAVYCHGNILLWQGAFDIDTKVPSVTVMWIFVASLDHRSLYACVAGAQTDTLPQHLSSKKKPEARYRLKSISCCT